VSETSQKLLIIGTHAEENPDKATLPFVLGSTALAMGTDVSVILQSTGVYLAMKGYADHVHASGFPPLVEMLETFFEAGGKLMVCSPCLMARKIDPADLILSAEVVAGATLVSEALEADGTITY
jgi:uncharacterized protein